MIQVSKFSGLLLVFIILVTLVTALAPYQATAGNAGTVVDLVLLPASQTVDADSTFDTTIQVQSNGQDVVGIDAFFIFNPAHLEVLEVTPGTTLNPIVTPSFDNTLGKIDYSAGTFASPFPSGTFTVATITWKAKSIVASTSTTIRFSTQLPRKTDVVAGETHVLRNTVDASLNIQVSGTTATIPATGGVAPAAPASITPPAPSTLTNAVIGTAPINRDASVQVNSNIDIAFSDAMDTASVQSAFSITPAIKGSFTWTGNMMTFKPETGMAYGQAYTVTISTGARSASGKNLSSAYSWSFTTASQQPKAAPASSPANLPVKPSVSPNPPTPAPSPVQTQKYFDPQSGLYFNSEAELKAFQLAHPQQPVDTASPSGASETTQTNWLLIGGIAAGVIVVLIIVFFSFFYVRRD